jgi:hypothetical protein
MDLRSVKSPSGTTAINVDKFVRTTYYYSIQRFYFNYYGRKTKLIKQSLHKIHYLLIPRF